MIIIFGGNVTGAEGTERTKSEIFVEAQVEDTFRKRRES